MEYKEVSVGSSASLVASGYIGSERRGLNPKSNLLKCLYGFLHSASSPYSSLRYKPYNLNDCEWEATIPYLRNGNRYLSRQINYPRFVDSLLRMTELLYSLNSDSNLVSVLFFYSFHKFINVDTAKNRQNVKYKYKFRNKNVILNFVLHSRNFFLILVSLFPTLTNP